MKGSDGSGQRYGGRRAQSRPGIYTARPAKNGSGAINKGRTTRRVQTAANNSTNSRAVTCESIYKGEVISSEGPHILEHPRSPAFVALRPLPRQSRRNLLAAMAPKPASTGGKAPASGTASKAPAKTTEKKAAKKTAKAPAASGEDKGKKRRKLRKETYSSYIYKGGLLWLDSATVTCS